MNKLLLSTLVACLAVAQAQGLPGFGKFFTFKATPILGQKTPFFGAHYVRQPMAMQTSQKRTFMAEAISFLGQNPAAMSFCAGVAVGALSTYKAFGLSRVVDQKGTDFLQTTFTTMKQQKINRNSFAKAETQRKQEEIQKALAAVRQDVPGYYPKQYLKLKEIEALLTVNTRNNSDAFDQPIYDYTNSEVKLEKCFEEELL